MDRKVALALSALMLGWLGGTTRADEPPAPGQGPPAQTQQTPPALPAVPSLQPSQICNGPCEHAPGGCCCAAESDWCWVPPPMMGDLFFGGLRLRAAGAGGNVTAFVGFTNAAGQSVAAE